MPRANRHYLPGHIWHHSPVPSKKIFTQVYVHSPALFALGILSQKTLSVEAHMANVKSQLASQSRVLASMVNVEAKHGVVTLSGTVDKRRLRHIQSKQ